MRYLALIFGLLGAAGSGFLGVSGLTAMAETKQREDIDLKRLRDLTKKASFN